MDKYIIQLANFDTFAYNPKAKTGRYPHKVLWYSSFSMYTLLIDLRRFIAMGK
jgi:hypothetical protein